MAQVRAFTESFDAYPDTVNQAGYGIQSTWIPIDGNSGTAMSLTAGRFGGRAFRMTSGGQTQYARRAVESATELAFGFAFRKVSTFGANSHICSLYSTANNQQWSLGFDVMNRLQWGLGAAYNLQTTTESVLINSTWHYIEVEYVLSDTVGLVQVYLDGEILPELTLATGDSKGHADTDVGIFALAIGGTATRDFDDLYCEVGGHVRVGEGRMDTSVPVSDVSAGSFVQSAGASLFGALDELPASQADYISATAAGSEFRLGFSNLGTVPQQIFGVQVESLSQKDEAGTRTMRNKVFSGAVEYDGETQALTLNSFTFKRDWMKLNPDGNIPWVAVSVNALEAGAEIVV